MRELVLFAFLLSFLATLVVLGTPPKLKAEVSPHSAMAGGTVRVTCRVARNEENRGLTIGIENYTSSLAQIWGDAGPVTFEKTFSHIPCEAGEALCQLVDYKGKITVARSNLEVAGCDGKRTTDLPLELQKLRPRAH